MTELFGRTNMIGRQSEAWRPVSFEKVTSLKARLILTARRFLDLQTASMWQDLVPLLKAGRGNVLDVGCGAQPYRHLFVPEVNYQGIDHVSAAKFGYQTPDTTYYEGDVWPVNDASVDLILCTETLEHVPDPALFLGEAARCLKAGGRLILTVPFAARWHYIPHDYWRFTPSGLERLLQNAQFQDIAIYARGNAFTVAIYKVMALFLPFLVPQQKSPVKRLLYLLIGLLTLPIVLALSCLGILSLSGKGGDDCLGYTAVAQRSPNSSGTGFAQIREENGLHQPGIAPLPNLQVP